MALPVIIDTDPGVDDALALLLAAASPELDVRAITTVAGNVSLDRATENARRIVPVAWAGRPLPPIHRGASGGTETAEGVHGADGLGGVTVTRLADGSTGYPASARVEFADAADAILHHANRAPGEVVLITLGPLTNAAEALRREPEGFRRLKGIVVMGGAFHEAGNVTPAAEFNIYVDPPAAQAVCDAGVPLTWVPVDVTHRCLLRSADLDRLPESAAGGLVRGMVRFYMEHHRLGYGDFACFLHDPLAVGIVMWPELARTTPLRVDVETEGRLTRGMTVADFRPAGYRAATPPNADVCLEVDAGTFCARFLERLARLP